jgi:hypothetical protein
MLFYIGLFRPAKQDLTNNARALRLIREVLESYRADHVLASALTETIDKIRENRRKYSDVKPLTNHNYSKQVYRSLATKLGGSPEGKAIAPVKSPMSVDSDRYFEQAKRMQRAGQDPLGERSTIAKRLKELNWQS